MCSIDMALVVWAYAMHIYSFIQVSKRKKKTKSYCRLSKTLRIRSTHQLQSFYVEMRVRAFVKLFRPDQFPIHQINPSHCNPNECQPTQPSNDNKFSNLLHFVCIELAFSCLVFSLLMAHLLFIFVRLRLLHILEECIKFPHTLLPAQSSARSSARK